MQARIDYQNLPPGGYRAMLGLEQYLSTCSLEKKLLDLVRLRISQINGCAFCLDMHWKELQVQREHEQRMYGLNAWRKSPYYTDRERAALAWSEAVTNLADGRVADAVYEESRPHFNQKQL